MMSLHSSMHSSQMKTEGPAISLRTSCWLFPQNEQYNNFSEPGFSDISPRSLQKLTGWPLGHHLCTTDENLVHQSVFHRIFGAEEVVTLGIALDCFDLLRGVPSEDLVQALAQIQDFLGMNLDIRRLPLEATHRLMNHDA